MFYKFCLKDLWLEKKLIWKYKKNVTFYRNNIFNFIFSETFIMLTLSFKMMILISISAFNESQT